MNDKKKLSMPARQLPQLFGLGLCAVLLVSLLLLYALPDKAVSNAERRRLRQMPDASLKRVLSGQFQNDLEPYLADQIPGRSLFLKTSSLAARDLYSFQDDNGLISWHGHLISLEQTVDENSLAYACRCLSLINQKYLEGTSCKVYLSIIPDKAFFVEEPKYVMMDYEELFSRVLEQTDFARYIRIENTLSLDDYYSTDSHWNQARLLKTAETLAKGMNIHIDTDLQEKTVLEDFQGVYRGQSAWKASGDSLQVLENAKMKDWTVTSYASGKPEVVSLYDLEKAEGMDPYDTFLSGAAGLITIDNPHGEKGRDLVIFRDSFGLSMAPLLAQGYEHTTIVDIRSLPISRVGNYVQFSDQDVLFLYSTSVLNHSSALLQ